MSRIFLTGGTGEIGRAIIPVLAKTHPIIALAHDSDGNNGQSNVKWVRGTIQRPETFLAELRACDVLIHLAAHVSNTSKDLQAINVDATRALILAAQQAGIRKIIVFSTAAVTQGYLTPYSESKTQMEKMLRELDVPLLVLRPTLVLVPHSKHVKGILHLCRLPLPFIPLPRSGDADLRPISGMEIGRALDAVLKKPFPSEIETYDLASPHPFTLRQLVEKAAEKNGIKKPIIGFSPQGMGSLHAFGKKYGMNFPSILARVAAQGESYRVNPSRFREKYGMEFSDPTRMVDETLN